MKKSSLNLEDIQKLYEAGEPHQVKQEFVKYLNANPNDAKALDLYGMLLFKEGAMDDAQTEIEKAIGINPKEPLFALHLATVLRAKGMFDETERILHKVITDHPYLAHAWNSLGSLYFAQRRWREASDSYQSAIDLNPHYLDAYYNLGLALTKDAHKKEAIEVYELLLELFPDHFGGRFQLASLLMQSERYQEAIQQFLMLEVNYPQHFETKVNLASCYLKLGKIQDAETYYLGALAIEPQDVQVLFNLGVINMQQGFTQKAIQYYSRILDLHPDLYEGHVNLGVLFLALKEKEKALAHFRSALRIRPHDRSTEHTIQILTQDESISASPQEYIQTLFDAYADHYDAHLKGTLHYAVPHLFYEALKDNCPTFEKKKFSILDLGCGTGLCGEVFKPVAKTLVGVDMSEQMLAIATQKQVYDELIHAEIHAFLRDKTTAYDLILAGDVVVYFGDLTSLFTDVAQALKKDGYFVFNTEISSKKDYELRESGRFAHQKEYINRLAKAHQLRLAGVQTKGLRLQDQEEVIGYLFVLQKKV